MRSVFYTFTFFFLLCSAVPGEEINLSQMLTDLVFSSAPNRTLIFPNGGGAVCHANESITGLYLNVGDRVRGGTDVGGAYKCMVEFSAVHSVPDKITYSEVTLSPLPDAVSTKPFRYANCTSTVVPISDEVSLTTTEGSSVSVSTKVTSGTSTKIAGDIALPIGSVKLGMSTSQEVVFNREDNNSNVNNHQTSSEVSQKLSLSITPMTLHETTLTKKMTSGYVDFDGIVQISGDVGLRVLNRQTSAQVNFVPLGSLTDLIPNYATLSALHLKGQLWVVRGEAVTRIDKEIKLTNNSEFCRSAPR